MTEELLHGKKIDADYLLDLAKRMRNVPVMYGLDGFDIDCVADLSTRLQKAASPTTYSPEEAVGFRCSASGKMRRELYSWMIDPQPVYLRAIPTPVSHVMGTKPFMYGIMCPDGTAYLDEICVDSNDSQTLVEVIEDQELEGHKVVPLYLHPPELRAACEGIADDYMTSDHHHPGYVLIPTAKFEAIRAALAAASDDSKLSDSYNPGSDLIAKPSPYQNVMGTTSPLTPEGDKP